MRLTEQSMLRLANDVRAADIVAADTERRRRVRPADDRHQAAHEQVEPTRHARPKWLRRLIPGGGHA